MTADQVDQRFFEFAENGDVELRNDLVVANQGLAIAFARRYRDRGVPQEDLEQVALEALVRSVDRFDPHRGLRFSTYAARTIEGQLKQYFRDRTWDVRVPRSARQLAASVRTSADALTQRLGRPPTPAEIAADLDLDLADVTLAMEAASAYRSESIDVGSASEPATVAGGELDGVEARIVAPQLLELLPENEREVVELRFFHDLSQSEIGIRIGVSQMQVSRLLRRALERLRRNAGSEV